MQRTTRVTADTAIKTNPGRVNWIQITANGAVIGDTWSIKDGTDATGSIKVDGRLQAANGTWLFPYIHRQGDPGIKCDTGIYFQHNAANGALIATVCFE